MTPKETAEKIAALYTAHGDADYIGEPVSQIEHMSQAAQFAIDEGYGDEVVLAAFFHDIGHICVSSGMGESMNGYGVKSHEKIGADFLRSVGFSSDIAQLVENHVQAKRYLTFADPLYYNNLSEASKATLEFQGGVMTEEEAEKFSTDPLFELSIRMRKWDELAKEINLPLISMEDIKQRIVKVLK